MNIDNLKERYSSLLIDIELELKNTIKSFGGAFYFITDDDPRLEKIDDISELELPLVDAYTYNYGNQDNYYVTSLHLDSNDLEIYGINENCSLSIEDEVTLEYIPISGMLDILEKLPNLPD